MSSAAGAQVTDECVAAFNELKLSKNLKYVIFKLTDDRKKIVLEKKAPCDSSMSMEAMHEQFIADLPEKDCRYAVYDFEYSLGESEGKRNKIFFVYWGNDNAPVRSKMVYSSSKEALKRSLSGIAIELQSADISDVSIEAFLDKAGVKKS